MAAFLGRIDAGQFRQRRLQRVPSPLWRLELRRVVGIDIGEEVGLLRVRMVAEVPVRGDERLLILVAIRS
ncbi:hypothetical protein HSR121_2511 [Halapricum desulfuricans]|uniref:Uncharacterized protein n=1 Tax=Halapricum desulfuricans TaxID=2841257 RepID=A0A897N1K8_9EURY|nr:hypothetical protein [Halapricum desulfuricans]QSG06832.1 hypothetical protein HSR121_2511 [Halapricum desulfuricans]